MRNYDPQIGRWWQADPYDQFASPYTGIGNNPINLVDPSGGFSLDFGTLGQITGSVLADRALITFGGALLGFGVDKLSGGSGWKGAAIGGAMAFGATYLPPINFGSGGGGAIGGIDAGANVARAGFGMLNTSVKEAVANAPMGISLSSREPLIMQANISKTPAVRGRVIVGDATDMVPQKAVVRKGSSNSVSPKKAYATSPVILKTSQTNGGVWTTAVGLTVDWVFGSGANNRTFNNDAVANSFRDARVINQVRDYWYNQVNAGKKTIYDGVTNFLGKKAWTGGNFGIKGFLAAGLDPMEQFVGSFTPTITSDGRNLTFTIQNTTSFKSLVYGIAPDWLRSTLGPGGNMTQTYIFTEPIDFNRIK